MIARMKKASLEELTWSEVRKDFAKVNATVAKIIDDLNPSKDYTLIKCRYPFGSEILQHDGIFCIPNKEGLVVPITSNHIPTKLQEKLSYNFLSNPVSMILKNTAEMYMVIKNTTIPFYASIPTGKIFGTWLVLSDKNFYTPSRFFWGMTAGARSIFMLPKITEATKYNKLKKTFNLHTDIPKTLLDHFELFKELANHSNFNENWDLEIVYFTKKWFSHLHDKKWIPFNYYLMSIAWQGTEYLRNQFTRDLLFSLIKQTHNIKPQPYIDDIVKHLLAIGIGAATGFVPAIDDTCGPIYNLQKIFVDVYQLKDYAPIIMRPQFLDLSGNQPIYYALQYPTMFDFSPRLRTGTTKINDLCDIASLLQKYLSEIKQHPFLLEGTLLHNLPHSIQYNFFHTTAINYADIRSSKYLPQEDPTFLTNFKNTNNNQFPENSPFVRGCIRIKPLRK